MKLNEKLFKALANKTRLEILQWLKDPENEIRVPTCLPIREEIKNYGGVCVVDLVNQSGLAQSTISSYLNMLEEVELVISERHGKWTYYRRNEQAVQELGDLIKEEL